jgi:drug/metabolite transporter (DMT)-like permease
MSSATCNIMSTKAKLAAIFTILFWSSAFVGIRAGLEGYSPGGLALMRFLTASVVMFFIYRQRKHRHAIARRDYVFILGTGVIGIAGYHIALNYGEIFVPAGIASFIISQTPLVTTLLAILFLGEHMKKLGVAGMLVSVIGIGLIALGEHGHIQYYLCLFYVIIAAIIGSLYAIMQKSLLKKYKVIDVTAYAIWSGTLFLLIFTPNLVFDLRHASWQATMAAVYLGVFPGALAYLTWSFVLSEIPVSRATTFLYFAPILATLLGWLWLGEVPAFIALIGGFVALVGLWMVNHSYKPKRG